MAQDLQYRVLGRNGAVYPGHSVTLAYLIIQTFPSLEAANRRAKSDDRPAAIASGQIPGAGGPVFSALDLLGHAFDQGVDVAIAFGDAVWEKETNACYWGTRDEGQAQADSVKRRFRELFERWPRLDVVRV